MQVADSDEGSYRLNDLGTANGAVTKLGAARETYADVPTRAQQLRLGRNHAHHALRIRYHCVCHVIQRLESPRAALWIHRRRS